MAGVGKQNAEPCIVSRTWTVDVELYLRACMRFELVDTDETSLSASATIKNMRIRELVFVYFAG